MSLGIKDVIPRVLKNLSGKRLSTFAQLTQAWDSLVGESQAKHSEPYALRGKILFARVDDSSRAFELSRKYKMSLIRRAQFIVGEENIKDIVFRVGELSRK
ncbi:MAG: DUF721 domain-containing protein [Candidatus Omnitrophica bacterium]|nr:DUF721 domain-containing protein [Candidatus Omnitrophota bacterium]